VQAASFVGVVFAFPAAVVGLVRKARRSGDEVRHQVRWLAYAITLATLLFGVALALGLSSASVNSAPSASSDALFGVAIAVLGLGVPLSVGVAIFRYRLYDIDVVINRTVVYGLLAAFITAVYAAIVVGVGTAVRSHVSSGVLPVVATAVIALAFQPVRDRARRVADRVVYGRRATPYEVLSSFAERIAGSSAIEEVLPRTARMLAEGTGAVRADVWLRVGDELRPAGSHPSPAAPGRLALGADGQIDVPSASRVVAVRHQDELLGALSVQKAPGDPLTVADGKLLEDVASQAGLVLRNVRLIEELRASRQRIVAAQDEERRRLERNIHDGAQQQLVALAVKIGLAEAMAERNPPQVKAMLAELREETTEALEHLRDLARGIYPPLLADQGLAPALRAQARKAPLPVTIEANGLGRFPQEIEAAVYFCTLEALQNVSKYARATGVAVGLSQDGERLTFTVRDDGVGFDTGATGYGTGLQGMADRLAALGGELRVTSSPGAGTLIEAAIPTGPAATD
jgi:signal transduction histidine kinase